MLTWFLVKKECVLPMLFDSIPIENYIFLCYMRIGIGNKTINSFYDWITKYVQPLSDKEVEMLNILIDLQVEQAHDKQTFEKWTVQNCTTIAEL